MAKRKRSSRASIENGASEPSLPPAILLRSPISSPNHAAPFESSSARVSAESVPRGVPRRSRTQHVTDAISAAESSHVFRASKELDTSLNGKACFTFPEVDIQGNYIPSSESSAASAKGNALTPKRNQSRGDKNTQRDGVATSKKISPVIASETIKDGAIADPEEDELDEVVEGPELDDVLGRPPPVNSNELPLPWKGRLGYACLNTYLRNANPPVFSSRTCRISSILGHRHPLADPTQPEHATKNRPDKTKPASIRLGQQYVESIGLANARDIIKMIRWNERYGIKFMRLSSEMFPFASHEEYGYKLAPFASEVLAEAGKVIAELGHRVTTHPGQFTQLASPRKTVIDNSVRDLEYHDEMLSLLRLPEQQDRDAVMILHMGGTFGDKQATLDRFRENFAGLSEGIKNRLVLENDDVSWSVHDLLPICHELNIPLVLDFHHHNIVFDSTKVREGTLDVIALFDEIASTWTRKGITQKMHYSEPVASAITPRQRRKHSARVMTLPPCAPTMDLMIEAKDKEQAVFQLMRTFKLPGFDLLNEIIPHERQDENRPVKMPRKKRLPKKSSASSQNLDQSHEITDPTPIPEDEIGMGGPERRVYWPLGKEEWLKPAKRSTQKKHEGTRTPERKKKVDEAVPTISTSDAEGVLSDAPSDSSSASIVPRKRGRPRAEPQRKSARVLKKSVNYGD